MSKYTLVVKSQVINEVTGAVEHTSKHSVRGLDSEDVTNMQAPLLEAVAAWNTHGIEGQGKDKAK